MKNAEFPETINNLDDVRLFIKAMERYSNIVGCKIDFIKKLEDLDFKSIQWWSENQVFGMGTQAFINEAT